MNKQPWLREGDLIYRLSDERHPRNTDMIVVQMANESHDKDGRADLASRLHEMITGAVPNPTDEAIDVVFNAMPNGIDGWLKDFGYRQFARRLLAELGQPAAHAADIARLERACRVAVMALAHATQEHGKVYESAYQAVSDALRIGSAALAQHQGESNG